MASRVDQLLRVASGAFLCFCSSKLKSTMQLASQMAFIKARCMRMGSLTMLVPLYRSDFTQSRRWNWRVYCVPVLGSRLRIISRCILVVLSRITSATISIKIKSNHLSSKPPITLLMCSAIKDAVHFCPTSISN